MIAIADGSGNIAHVNKYDAYGVPNPVNQGRFQYTGQMWIAELGLYHYKARAYHPRLGRFMQTDPIGYARGTNLYAYVTNDPANRVDPSGLCDGSATPNYDWPTKCPTILVSARRVPGSTWVYDAIRLSPFQREIESHFARALAQLSMALGTATGGESQEGEKEPPLCTYGPSTASGAISVEAYTPTLGGGVTAGVHNGHDFVRGRLGYGWGGGVTYNPQGGLPVTPSDPYKGGAMITISAQLGVAVGIPWTPIAASFSFEGGWNISTQDGFTTVKNPSFAIGRKAKKGLQGAANVGASLAIYGSSYETITSEGTCRAGPRP